ncbi:RNA polymerase sigma factor [Zhihengliuella halotolerans]|uniref:RNA polymerase sigma-70 factor (ECF subfamily) n=1 Tax=Zhihengliuella halotolerans TaxID=370736 RepID=A0A4Q8AGQ9_9MICC|nr:RNA polymerase sigma factor [Zhihengliuella halotolerans]RZU63508.1 RNA polymerase sigma-70 factor (ECF subfamily) [Zhihengliuella halotolerans]
MAAILTDDVLEQARHGDTGALTAIYQNLAAPVHGYLAAKGLEDPEAAAQEVFLTVFARLADVTGGAAGLRKFTFSIAHARMVDATRARARAPLAVEYDAATDPRVESSPQDELLGRLESGNLAQALESLVPDQRECVMLRIVAGMSIEETAEIMGKSAGSIKQLQRRGLLTMKKSLEEVNGDD